MSVLFGGWRVGYTTFLTLYSNYQGPAYYLRVYRQYLVPIFKYDTPLIAAFAKGLSTLQTTTVKAIKSLTGQIASYTLSTYLTRSLLSLQPLPDRFVDLKTSSQLIISYTTKGSALRTLSFLDQPKRLFYQQFTNNSAFHKSQVSNRETTSVVDKVKAEYSLGLFLRRRRDLALSRKLLQRKLTRLIPASFRLKCNIRRADGIFRTPLLYQKQFFQYRRGTFNAYYKCIYPSSPTFRRSYKVYFQANDRSQLSGRELQAKVYTKRYLGSEVRLIDIDFLLNTGRFYRAYEIL